ncbi:MAG TPA: BtpA/SgcQ family protein [Phycisphaerae bacterium]|nr:BtpA/SgcQ family protein [Phycisphaerae bacterium]
MFSPPRPFLVGMIHLPPLPGSPRHQLSLAGLTDHALRDARRLHEAGFGALLIENFGDVPFHGDRIESATIAAMGILAAEIRSATKLPVGINALRNDAISALGIAAAAEAAFIRVNVHTGVAATDQGILQGRADETLRYRRRLNRDIAIFADVHVKHATPISQPDIALAAEETAYRGLADGLIVTGTTTGRAADLDAVSRVKQAVPDRPVLVGSGATADNVARILAVADGVIVGSSLKPGGRPDEPIDPQLARAFIQAATERGNA